MIDQNAWLAARLEGAPEQLRVRIADALAAVPAEGALHDRLARAAEDCVVRGMRDASRESALELLAGDALFTHACEAAAEVGSDVLAAFVSSWDANRLETLIPTAT